MSCLILRTRPEYFEVKSKKFLVKGFEEDKGKENRIMGIDKKRLLKERCHAVIDYYSMAEPDALQNFAIDRQRAVGSLFVVSRRLPEDVTQSYVEKNHKRQPENNKLGNTAHKTLQLRQARYWEDPRRGKDLLTT